MKSLFSLLCAAVPFLPAAATDALFERFVNPPPETRLQAWWHWCGDNATKAGISADLKAMGEKGIGVAHVFAPAMMGSIPGYHAELLTPEWKDLFSHAVAEAKRNGVKLGFHNCPGWSSSGGPWIRPEDSMKVVVASEMDVAAGTEKVQLPRPQTSCGFYRDIAVLAFPLPKTVEPDKVSASFPGDSAAFLEGSKPLVLPLGKPGATCSVTLSYPEPISPTSAILSVDDTQFYTKGTIEASSDGKTWTKATDFTYTLFNAPKTPKVLRLANPPTNAKHFRLTFNYIPTPPWVGVRDKRLLAVTFTDLPMIENVDDKNASSTAFGYVPPRAGEAKRPGIPKDSFVNLTSRLSPDGTLNLPVSASAMRVLRIGYTSTGKGPAPATLGGLECDKLSKRGLGAHWPHMPRVLLDTPGAKGTVVLSLIDSYEVGGQNWTEDFPVEFKRRRGYDITPYLPALVGYNVGTYGETAKFLYDVQRTVSDLFAENYYDYFTELCHREGIDAATEAYGGPFDSMRCGATCDVPTGEFWIGRGKTGSPRIASSCAHLNGRVRVAAEAFTTETKEGRWQVTPHQLRVEGDLGWLEGISQIVFHSYLHQPFLNVAPGLSLGRHGTQLNRHTTWWPELNVWSDYVHRGQTLLQSGRPRAEFLILSGESTPHAFPYPSALVRAGYNFDWCGAADIQRLQNTANGGVAVPGGASYAALHLGQDRYLSLATLEKIQALAAGGARIAGTKPIASPSLSDDPARWQSLADSLWSAKVIKASSDSNAPKDLKVLDCATPEAAAKAFGMRPDADTRGLLRTLHREVDGRDLYFVVNDSGETFHAAVSLVGKGAPARWDAATGTAQPLVVATSDGAGRVRPVLRLRPHDSCFVVFDPAATPVAGEEPKVEYADVSILSARYCARDDRTLGRDVTLALRARLAKGGRTFSVTNEELGGDPASNHYKILELTYTVDGARRQQTVQERSSVSLVFARPPAEPKERVVADLSTDWTATFSGKNAPVGTVPFAKLSSWSVSNDPRLKYFAGRARYVKEVEQLKVEKLNGPVILDLGDVHELANVYVNGKFLATLWESPYRIELPPELFNLSTIQPFNLSVEVVNTWPNRLIGDAKARKDSASEPMEKGYPKWVLEDRPDSGTGIFTWSNWLGGWHADDALLPAGLLGPVRLVTK